VIPRKHDALRLSGKPEVPRIRVERATRLKVRGDLRLVLPEQHHLAQSTVVILVRDFDRVRAVHLRRQHRHRTPRHDACQPSCSPDVL